MFDWDKLNKVLVPDAEIPPNSMTSREYADRCGLTRQLALGRLLQLEAKGEIKSVMVKHHRYFYFEDGVDVT